mgnify:FL=1
MIWDVIIGFVLLVAGTYIGCTMALRRFSAKTSMTQNPENQCETTTNPVIDSPRCELSPKERCSSR